MAEDKIKKKEEQLQDEQLQDEQLQDEQLDEISGGLGAIPLFKKL